MKFPLRVLHNLRILAPVISLALFETVGCSPVLPLLGLALGDGRRPAAVATGPFGGAPTMAQNNNRSENAVRDVLDHVENEQVLPSCRSQLEGGQTASFEGEQCSLRPTCLPGQDRPVVMLLCPAAPSSPTTAASMLSLPADEKSRAVGEWRWRASGSY